MLAALVPGGLADSLPLPEIGAGALLALAVWLILTGRLIPRVTHQERVADLLTERDVLRAALAEQQQLTRDLMVTAEVTRGVMRALDPAPGRESDEPPEQARPARAGS